MGPAAAISLAPSQRWRAVSSDELIWAVWDDAYIVFHRPSGKTHFVNESTWLLLTDLLREPRELPAVVEELARLRHLEVNEELRAQIWELLLRFEHLGLVVRT
ncbi:MAG TPA: HPr-rel-A system PqqD family peptide chaperone [Steroidobacteraceae bacterium]